MPSQLPVVPVPGPYTPVRQVEGQHLFAYSVMLPLDDPEARAVVLDPAAVLGVSAGCWWCGRRYSPDLAQERCEGTPEF